MACRCSSCTAASMALRGGIRAPSSPRSGSHHVVRLPNLNASPFALSPATAAASRCTASKSAAGSTSTYACRRARRVGLPHVGLVCRTAEPAATGRPAAAPFEPSSTSHPNPNPAHGVGTGLHELVDQPRRRPRLTVVLEVRCADRRSQRAPQQAARGEAHRARARRERRAGGTSDVVESAN